jgi:hypothetical protein
MNMSLLARSPIAVDHYRPVTGAWLRLSAQPPPYLLSIFGEIPLDRVKVKARQDRFRWLPLEEKREGLADQSRAVRGRRKVAHVSGGNADLVPMAVDTDDKAFDFPIVR